MTEVVADELGARLGGTIPSNEFVPEESRWRRWRARRRALSRLRKLGPGVVPRSLWWLLAVLVAAAVGLGTAAAGTFAWSQWRIEQVRDEFEAKLAETRAASTEALRPSAVGGSGLSASEVTVEVVATAGGTRRGVGVVTAVEPETTYVLTSHKLVEPGTFTPAPPVTVVGAGGRWTAQVWAWDARSGMALLAVKGAAGLAPRPWAPVDRPVAGETVTVPLPRNAPQEPVTVLQAVVVSADAQKLVIRTPTGAPPGSPVLDTEGRLVAVVVDAEPATGAPRPQRACGPLLECP